MNTFLRYCVGLDISKDTLQVCLSVIDASGRVTVKATTKVVNKPTGFTALRNWAVRHRKLDLPLTYLMESTGVYHEAVAWHLHQHDQQVSILLPNKAKHYLKSLGYKSKNDKIDAQGLSRMGLDGAARAAAAADLETAFQESLCPSAADAPASQRRTVSGCRNSRHSLPTSSTRWSIVLSTMRSLVSNSPNSLRFTTPRSKPWKTP